ncbi:MAG: hypothetical protein NW223_22800 [Hyphomicrobiaceae bacterium]|nr:hypothetical protein [Hyphomicrobiaceae bacterium]
MTDLERTLALVVAALAEAREKGDALRITHLMRRRDAICAALAAPEHHAVPAAEPQAPTAASSTAIAA